MLEFILEPAKIFFEKGIDAYRKTQEHKNLRIAIQDRIRREVRFNIALLTEFSTEKNGTSKHEDVIRQGLIRSLRTSAFDDADSGIVPLTLFFDEELKSDIWPVKAFDNAQGKYMGWVRALETQYDLLERTYYRIRIARTFAECGKVHGDIDYIRFLLMAFEKSLAASKIK